MERGRLNGLDALRGIAALVVFYHHLASNYGHETRFTTLAADWSVDMFFVLSGFVLSRAYGEKLANGLPTWKFIAARYRRLWAPVAIGTLVGAVAFGIRGELTLPIALTGITTAAFLPALWMSWYLFPLNSPAWSLFAEIFSNFLHALLRRVRPVYFIALFLPGYIMTTAHTGAPIFGQNIADLVPSLFRALTAYFIGVQLYRTLGARTLSIPPWAGLLAFVALLAILPLLPGIEAGLFFTLVAAPAIVVVSARLPENRLARAAGAVSFPLYAVHAPILLLAVASGASMLVAGVGLALAIIGCMVIETRAIVPVPTLTSAPA